MNKEIRCTGTYRGKVCNRFLGVAENMTGSFRTKCERCNSIVTITDGRLAHLKSPSPATSQLVKT